MKNRVIKASIFISIIFFVDLLVCHMALIDLYQAELISELEFNENLIINDYHSLLKYSVIYMFVYIFYINYVIGKERIEILIRYTSSESYYKSIIKNVLGVSFIFSFIHEMESIILTLLYGNINLLIEHGWIQGNIMQLLVCTLFYAIVFLFYKMLSTQMSDSIAYIVTIASFALIYYISVIVITPEWFLFKDLELLYNLCTENYSYEACGMALVRWAAIGALLYIIFIEIAKRRDYIKNEKR